jgi:hypothetical protein
MATQTTTQTLVTAANLTALIDLYRHHAAAQRRMVSSRNRVVVRSRNTVNPEWSERSLNAFNAHGDMMDAVRTRLGELGYGHLALQLQYEDTAYRRRAWRVISGETVSGNITHAIRTTRRVIAAIRAEVPTWTCADRMSHPAHIWTGPAHTDWLCKGTVR